MKSMNCIINDEEELFKVLYFIVKVGIKYILLLKSKKSQNIRENIKNENKILSLEKSRQVIYKIFL